MTEMLRHIFLDNLVLKILALALATSLVLAKREDQTTIITIDVRVRVTHPEHLVLTSPTIDKVKITVEGKYNRLRRFEADGDSAVDVNLSGLEEGQVTFEPELFRMPPDLKVRQVRPAAMLVQFEKRIQRTIPIQASLDGDPQAGYRVTQVTVEPAAVTVEGAESAVKALQSVRTERISLAGRIQTTSMPVILESPPSNVDFRERGQRHQVTVVIEEKRGTRVVQGVSVEVRDVPIDEHGFEVSPAVVEVAINGPQSLVAGLETEQLVAYVSAAELSDDRVQARQVQVEAPEALTVTDVEPKKVTLVRVQPPPPPPPPPDAGVDAGADDGEAGGDEPGKRKPGDK